MGLEGVELVMEVEDRFETSFPHSAVEKIQTIGELHEFIMTRIRRQDTTECSSAAMFYPIRKLLTDSFGVERCSVRPSTTLESLVDAGNRQSFWRQIETSLSSNLPRLERSKWLHWSGDVFPPDCSTVAQLVERCVDLNRITGEFGPNESDAVWKVLCKLVSGVAGVDESKLKMNTNFVNDLGF